MLSRSNSPSSLSGRPGIAWLGAGIIATAGGVLALLNPMAATLTVEQIAGWIFLFVGVLQAIDAFRAGSWGGKALAIVLAVLLVLLGMSLLAEPLRGILALTFTVAILFLASGIAKMSLAWRMRQHRYFWPVLISGALSILFALLIFFNFPWSAVTVLGLLLGIDLVSWGISLIAIWAVGNAA
ncbi:MAG: DUF308 domain-containing protein [Alphaproteobacteria bacterium]|nr:hypothetical protein [Rhizobiaceae bacterium]MBU3962827.1 DUF308 domain-containing protein [Alphaproteobacteria bacterium]MBU4051533.1 DUF308 domain-containing protein [Alphaproteobacteria bacterium]MBU4090733.1 DUF308 domain-containing protein [Alphaproteobacteria bacterium]MBU4156289.1 DUF308 domain-containing protein [Alphaproteobacteria bacterium]